MAVQTFTLFGEWLRLFCMLALYGRVHDKGMKSAGAEGAYCDQIVMNGALGLNSASSLYSISQEFLANEGAKCTS